MERIIDLVCGMEVNPDTTEFKATFEGRVFFFCSAQCKGKFEAHSQMYAQPQAETKAPA